MAEKLLYNGIALPEIPEKYKSSHPYWVISYHYINNSYDLVMSDKPVTIASSKGTASTYPYLAVNSTGENLHYYRLYYFPEVSSNWKLEYGYNAAHDGFVVGGDNPIYANYDLYCYTGDEYAHAGSGIFLHGSLPTGGIIIRCPDSVTQGLFIGIACDSIDKNYIDFTCELSGNTSPQTMLMPNSDKTVRLQCAKDEAAGSLTIEVASTENPALTASKTIAVIPHDWTYPDDEDDPGGDPGGNPGGGGGWDETSMVTGVSLYVYPSTVVPGGRATVEVSVNGIGNYSQAFTARLSGHSSPETELFSAGYSCNVWIDKAETAEYVLVTVASVQDPTVTATEMIYIDYSGTEEEGTTQQQLQQAFWKGFAAARAYFQEANVTGTINIAKDAEPTSKAGKLRRSFWQGFVSALTVAAAETVPDGALISSDGYILRDCNGVYLIAKEDA